MSKILTMKIVLTISILAFYMDCMGQNFTKSIGIRGGYTSGFAYRQYIAGDGALRFMAGVSDNGLLLTGLKEQFHPYLQQYSGNLHFYTGYGMHAGYRYTNHFTVFYKEIFYREHKFNPVLGVDGLVGVEYRLEVIPLVIGVELKPFLEYSIHEFFRLNPGDFGIIVMYQL